MAQRKRAIPWTSSPCSASRSKKTDEGKPFFRSADNTLWKNYKFYTRLLWANMPSYFLTTFAVQLAILGRFDLEIFLGGYLFLFLPPFATFKSLSYKMENAFEKSANFSLKKLIEKDIDLQGQHRKLMAHPELQVFKMKEAAKLRRSYNFASSPKSVG